VLLTATLMHPEYPSFTLPYLLKATYRDGAMLSAPQPCASIQGTQLLAEDLFYNMPSRRRALSSASEEYRRIVKVLSRYALHHPQVAFSCRRADQTQTRKRSADVHTSGSGKFLEVVRQVYGAEVARELLHVQYEDTERYHFRVEGYVSHPNYSRKTATFLLFINHRLVENSSLKKAIDMVYANYLPKRTHPFLYLSLEIRPQNVDVNVHPTKSEVHFLYETEVIELVQQQLENALVGCNSSRTFYAADSLIGTVHSGTTRCDSSTSLKSVVVACVVGSSSSASSDGLAGQPVSSSSGDGAGAGGRPKKRARSDDSLYQHELVRVDHRERTLEEFGIRDRGSLVEVGPFAIAHLLTITHSPSYSPIRLCTHSLMHPHAHLHTLTHSPIHPFTHTHTHTRMYTRMYTNTLTLTDVHNHTRITHTLSLSCIHTLAFTHSHIHTHIHTHS
jgi:DNA mismatch repair protein, C-terminal domain